MRACFTRLKARLKRQGLWSPLDDTGLIRTSICCARFLTFLREIEITADPVVKSLLGTLAVQQRDLARRSLAQYLVIDRKRLRFSEINELIAELCR
jgi:hypothetical protein